MRLNTMLSLLPPHINSNQFRNLYAEWNTEKGKVYLIRYYFNIFF